MSQPDTSLTITIPMQLRRRSGRKLVVVPDGLPAAVAKPQRDDELVRAIVKAHRWRRRIESGQSRSITDLAAQGGVRDAWVWRMLTLTLLAPDIVEAILNGWPPADIGVAALMERFPFEWERQRASLVLRLGSAWVGE